MQAEMNKLFAEGGVMQEGGTVDPISGNEVPPGAMAEEVRDDIPAQLSEGEFVFPADVVRFIGLQTLMKLRDKAKMGLKRMNDIGQMGNAEEVEDGEALFGGEEEMDDEMFSSEIDSIMSEDEGGDEDRNYAEGGYIVPENKQRYRDAPIKGFEMVPMTNNEGQTIYVPFINGVAQLGIPSGYKVKSAASSETPAAPSTPTTGDTVNAGGSDGSGGGDGGGSSTSSPGFSIGEDGFAVANTTNSTVAGLIGTVASMVTGIPGLSAIGKSVAEQTNFANDQAAMSFNVAVSDTTAAANNEGVTTAAATPGAAGTGGSAASAAAAAAAAAATDGMSAAAQGAASQAAADAAIGGASAAAAAAAGAAAAAAADNGEAAEGGNTAANAAAAADGGGSSSAGAGAGAAGGGNAAGGDGNSGDGGTGDSSTAGDSFAKGGLVSKRKKSPESTKRNGLASR